MSRKEQVFKRRNDMYYITLLVYVAFLALYILITGTIEDNTVKFGFKDPVVYIVGIFILHAMTMLLTNMIRNRRLVITHDSMIFRSRFRERRVPYSSIERISLKRDRRKPNDGSFAVLKVHVTDPRRGMRRRAVRIRVANYEHEKELYQVLKKLQSDLKHVSAKTGDGNQEHSTS
ncbi:MAG: hypothetical protein C0600_11400 [Ignavibacteria bacterium]|nr:MAG: hypothetical protein C0600_11400 [Ignavibacteria bacterium]